MKKGLYERILKEKDLIHDNRITKRKVDASEESKTLSINYQKFLREKLSSFEKLEDKISFIKDLNRFIGIDNYIDNDKDLIELTAYHDDELELKNLSEFRPKTSLSSSTLFVGSANGPSLEGELRREIRTSDEIYMLISFIKFSGLRLILDELKEFTKTKKLKVITTSYMGASDYKAILELSKLPNTEIKISYDTDRTRLHAKSYLFIRDTGFSTAYIGSSNLSNPAMTSGLEWNLKVSEYTSKDIITSIKKSFETYWNDDEFYNFSVTDEENKQRLRDSLDLKKYESKSMVFFDLKPYSHQKQILDDLEFERKENKSYRNLVVAATGTGKTMIAAFDYNKQLIDGPKKLLFLAHRKEILEQSLYTFRNVLKDQNFGELYVDGNVPSDFSHVFASIQTLNSNDKFKDFSKDQFDFIVIDETHHASATTYEKILKYFKPKILLGLTATPERHDGKDILEFFDDRIASEIRLTDAIDRKLLSPFHYFVVTDNVPLSNLTWSRGKYEVRDLENVYVFNQHKAKARVQLIQDKIYEYISDVGRMKALGFCVSIEHAKFMAESFNKLGIPSIALHSKTATQERESSKTALEKGEINCIFTVDLFNEGVDIPSVDTVLFLRPTESLTIFLQQLGRGLRLSENKDALTVLDFIGQAHKNYDFSYKLKAISKKTSRSLKKDIREDYLPMPLGSHIHMEKVAKEYILRNINSSEFNLNSLRAMVRNFKTYFNADLNLRNFLDLYDIDKNKFYAKYSFYKLLNEEGLLNNYELKDPSLLKSSLRRFSRVTSKSFINFSKKIINEDLDISNLNSKEQKMLSMFYYTVWTEVPEVSFQSSIDDLIKNNKSFIDELNELLDYNLNKLKIIELEYEDKEIPLDIYGDYTIDQVMAAFGKTHENHKFPMRQGVTYVKEYDTDIFFITIHKNEADYLPTTMYNDYAINESLFNWESQNKTTTSSKTGQRYINNSKNHKVLLFVREFNSSYGVSSPFTFLGNARYVSHTGNAPIEIVWKLDHPIPERIIRESNLRAVN